MSDLHRPTVRVRPRLGELLQEAGLITDVQLQAALDEQVGTGARLGQVLLSQGSVTESQLLQVLAGHFGLRWVDLEDQVPDVAVGRLVRESFARRHLVLPIGWEDDRLLVAMANPTDVFALDDVRSMTGHKVTVVMADQVQLTETIERVWGSRAEGILRLASDDAAVEEQEAERPGPADSPSDAPVVRFVNELLRRAVAERASDVHLEPGDRELRIRFRVDGVLHDVMVVPHSIRSSVVSRLKIMGELDIAERRMP
ncbi:MAG: GspE/PulE family protein, partial [Acidimicrobiales bacterium]